MKRPRRLLAALLALVVVLALSATGAYALFGEAIARAVIAARLEGAGFEVTRLRVDRAGFGEVVVSDLVLGPHAWLSAGSVAATFDLGTLLGGRLGEITVRDGAWTVRIDGRAVHLHPPDASAPAAGPPRVPFRRLEIESSALRVDVDGARHDVAVSGALRGTVGGGATGDLSLRFDGTAAQLSGRYEPPQDGAPATLRAAAEAPDAAMTVAGVAVTASALRLEADLGFAGGGPDGTLSAKADELALPGAALRLAGVEVTLPLTAPARDPAVAAELRTSGTGSFSIADVRAAGRALDGLSGTFTVAGGRLDGDATWRMLDAAEVALRFSADVGAEPPRAEVGIAAAEFSVADPAGFARTLLGPAADGWRAGGRLALDGRVELAGGTLRSHLDVRVAEGRLVNRRRGFELDGIEGTVRLSGLAPPVIEPAQRLRFGGGRVGELPLTGGEAVFSLNTEGTVAVTGLRWTMGEYGEFESEPFSLRPAAPVVTTTVTAREVGLGPWLVALSGGWARGDGTMDGSFEVALDPGSPRAPISFGTGTLEAQPEGGWVEIGAGEELVKLLKASDPRFRDPEFRANVGDRIVAALRDFAFSMLRLRFLENGLLRLEVAGRGRRGEHPIEIGSLTLNIRGFEEYLALVVASSRRSGS